MTGALVLGPTSGAFAAEEADAPQAVEAQAAEMSPASEATESATTQENAEASSTAKTSGAAKTAAAKPAAADVVTEDTKADVSAPASASVVTVKIAGTAKVGKKLTAKSTVKKTKGLKTTTSYTWYANGKQVGTGKNYKLKSKDFKKRIAVKAQVAWASNVASGSANTAQTSTSSTDSKTSAKTKSVAKQKASLKVKVKVKGSAKVGKTLKAKATVKKTKGVKANGKYTWYVSGKKVKTGKTLKVKKAYVGKTIKVVYKVKTKANGTYYKASKKASKKAGKVKYDVSSAAIKKTALGATGIPYVFGSSSRSGADCSGLVKLVYGEHGVSLGNTDSAIRAQGKAVSASNAKPGDVIHYPGHVAIYVGKGKMVEAQMPGTKSTVSAVRAGGTFLRMV